MLPSLHNQCQPPASRGWPSSSASNKDFGRIQWNRLEPIGVGACNQIIASGFGAAGIKAFFTVILRFSTAPPLHSAVVARLEAAPARSSVPHSFTRHFRPPRPPRTVKTINSSRWRGLKRESEHRLEPMEGVDFFQNLLRSLRSRTLIADDGTGSR